MDVCEAAVWFGAFSVIGWVYECIYCAIKTGAWDNRGFLYGPVCPIYGVGASAAVLLCSAVPAGGAGPALWQVFLLCAAGSAVLEYATSYFLERWFHMRWWDYSHVPLNLNGRVCLPFALCFGAAGTLIWQFLPPVLAGAGAGVPQVAWELGALVVVGLTSADLALTVSALTDLTKRLETATADFDAVMETAVADVAARRVPLGADMRAGAKRAAAELTGMQRRTLRTIRTHSTAARTAAAERIGEVLRRR